MGLFRTDLSEQEQQEFRQWARENYKPYQPIPGIWHPCVKMNAEAGTSFSADHIGDNQVFIAIDELKG